MTGWTDDRKTGFLIRLIDPRRDFVFFARAGGWVFEHDRRRGHHHRFGGRQFRWRIEIQNFSTFRALVDQSVSSAANEQPRAAGVAHDFDVVELALDHGSLILSSPSAISAGGKAPDSII